MTNRPNIMILMAEDTGRHQGCYDDPAAHTPAIDQLAADGKRYTHAFSNAPVCAPSRSAMMMGKTAFSQGSHHMRSTLLNHPIVFTELLREAGYYVNWANKTDFNFEPRASFADDRHEWFDDLANGKLPDQPSLLYHNFAVSHESKMWPDCWEENVAPYLDDNERIDPAKVHVPAYLPDEPEVRADLARYYESLIVQDKGVARALKALDDSGQRDNTIVFYYADHGRGLLREKRWMYEAGIHLPLIVRAPGLTDPGSVSNELISWLDLAPTILSLCNAKPIDGAQGRVFLGPEKAPPPEYVFAGRDRMDEVFDRVRTARSQQYLYIRNDFPQLPYASRQQYMEKQWTTQVTRRLFAEAKLSPEQSQWYAPEKPAEEFYDCDADPENVNNLAENPKYADAIAAHRQALGDFLERTGDLAQQPEQDLIDQGLVANRLPEYYERVTPLSAEHRVGAEVAPVEMPK